MLTTASLAVSKQIVHSYVESPPPLLLALLLLLLLLLGSESFVVVELLTPDAVEPLPLFTPLASLAVAPSTSSSRALPLLLLPADISTGAGDDAGAYDVFDALLVASGRSMSADVDAMLL